LADDPNGMTQQTGQTTHTPATALAKSIEALHSADFFPCLARYLQQLTPFSGIFVTRLYRSAAPRHVYDNVRAERRAVVVDQYLDNAYLLDPFYNAFLNGKVQSVNRLRDVAPDRFTRSTYYHRYYGNIELRDEIGILIAMSDQSAVFYSIGRLGHENRFSARSVAALRGAIPFITALTRQHLARDPDTGRPASMDRSMSDALGRFGQDVLTAREREVAAYILKGHSSASIAALTGLAIGTVKIHRKNLYRKLRISSQSELFAAFLQTVLS
jgi:DNA-binding CsgD family transcriptional regulator